MCLSLSYDLTKFYQISLVKLNLFQYKSDKRPGIFRFETVFSTTDSRYTCMSHHTSISYEKTTQQATTSVIVRSLLIQLTLSF